ncbi:MAG: large subunit ribosomal protein L18 [Chitinophagales bacterium]|jgi:large subunit ribosomal protein L18|tara:strand:- start:483 stop:833 length:351 start_codon:yes stop_codon:yes gene_type:complete
MAFSNIKRRKRIKRGIRNKVTGTAQRPRLSVFRSNKAIYAQLIDDVTGQTLASATSKDSAISGGNKVEQSKKVGTMLADRAKTAKIETVVFDRNGFRFHGRIAALAEGARENGLKF